MTLDRYVGIDPYVELQSQAAGASLGLLGLETEGYVKDLKILSLEHGINVCRFISTAERAITRRDGQFVPKELPMATLLENLKRMYPSLQDYIDRTPEVKQCLETTLKAVRQGTDLPDPNCIEYAREYLALVRDAVAQYNAIAELDSPVVFVGSGDK
jgi:hypothetical protein